jgi:hypothetical protein
VRGLHVGRIIEFEVDAADTAAAESAAAEMCERILANPVIEDYDVTVKLEHRLPGRSILPATEQPPVGAKSVTVKGSSSPTDTAYSAAATAALSAPVSYPETDAERQGRGGR